MSRLKTDLLVAAVIITGGSGGISMASAEPVDVIASFSILGDLVSEIGGEHVRVTTLVGPNGDAHVYAPSPADARATAQANLVVVNGLGFEGWIDRLVEASGYTGPVAVISEGADTIETGQSHERAAEASDPTQDGHAAEEHASDSAQEEGDDHARADRQDRQSDEAAGTHAEEGRHQYHAGDVDPHAWQSVKNAVVYVKNIADALCGIDAGNCGSFRANAAAYTDELAALDTSIRAQLSAIPEEQRKVITSHDAFGYFGHAYDVEFLSPQGVSTDSEASAADVGSLIAQIREEKVTALFVENVSDPRLIEQIGRETGVRPGGELYSDALSGADAPAATYVRMMRHNADTLLSAMQGS